MPGVKLCYKHLVNKETGRGKKGGNFSFKIIDFFISFLFHSFCCREYLPKYFLKRNS